MKLSDLNKEEKRVIVDKGTEAPYSGEYDDKFDDGIYSCRWCGSYLYRSDDKFDSGCGWPSFDDEILGSVNNSTDADNRRVEITCNRCGGHLGHIFTGEKLTQKDVRHCVNSASLKFIEPKDVIKEKSIYLGGGCFWCIEATLKMLNGVISATPGYAGGEDYDVTYENVKESGHAEVVKVTYDPTIVSLEKILDVFFVSHDPTSIDKQGNDIGAQYRSVIYTEGDDMEIVESYIKKIGVNYEKDIVTEVLPIRETPTGSFYEAEEYHHNYFGKNPNQPYCKVVIDPKIEKVKKYLDK